MSSTQTDWKKHLGNWATMFRIFSAPVIVVLILLQPSYWNWISAILFIIASITDWLDGYWARKYNGVSDLGKLLDPIADKFLVSSVLIMMISLQRIEAILVVILLNRDILINGLRSFAATQGLVISAGQLGKWKTGVQMVAIPMLLVDQNIFSLPLKEIGYWGLWGSLVLSLLSGAQYTYNYFQKK